MLSHEDLVAPLIEFMILESLASTAVDSQPSCATIPGGILNQGSPGDLPFGKLSISYQDLLFVEVVIFKSESII